MFKNNKLTLVLSLVLAGISAAESMKRSHSGDDFSHDDVRPIQIARIEDLSAASNVLPAAIAMPVNLSIEEDPIVEAEVVGAIGAEATIEEIFGFELQTHIENSINRDREQFEACCTIDGSRFSSSDFVARRLSFFFQEDAESLSLFEKFISQQSRPVVLKIIKFAIENFKLLGSEDIRNGFLSATNRAEALIVLERQEEIQRAMYTRFIEQYPTREALLASEEIVSSQESLQAFRSLIISQVDRLADFCCELIADSSKEEDYFDQAVFIEGFPRVTLFSIQLVLEHNFNTKLCLDFLDYFLEMGPSLEIGEIERAYPRPELINTGTLARQICAILQGLLKQRIDQFCAEKEVTL